jgi:hypothetical protein
MKYKRIIAGLALFCTSLLAQANPIRHDVTGSLTGVTGNLTNFKVGDSFSGWIQFDWDVIYNTNNPPIGWTGGEVYSNALSYNFTFADYTIYSNGGVDTFMERDRPTILDGSYTPMAAQDLGPQTSRPNTLIDELMFYGSGFHFYYWESHAIYQNETSVGGRITSIGQGYTVPEPPSTTLLLLGLIGIYLFRQRASLSHKAN